MVTRQFYVLLLHNLSAKVAWKMNVDESQQNKKIPRYESFCILRWEKFCLLFYLLFLLGFLRSFELKPSSTLQTQHVQWWIWILKFWKLLTLKLKISWWHLKSIIESIPEFLIVRLPIFLHILDVGVNNSSKNIHNKPQYVKRVELNSAKSEEANNGLNHRFWDPNHTCGQRGANWN